MDVRREAGCPVAVNSRRSCNVGVPRSSLRQQSSPSFTVKAGHSNTCRQPQSPSLLSPSLPRSPPFSLCFSFSLALVSFSHLLLGVLVVDADDDLSRARPEVADRRAPQRQPQRLVVLLPDERVERLEAARGLGQKGQVFLGLFFSSRARGGWVSRDPFGRPLTSVGKLRTKPCTVQASPTL